MNQYIDLTNLKAYATIDDITKLCQLAKKYHTASVCVNPYYIPLAKDLLSDSNVLVCTVIGFPLGANTIESKVFEACDSIEKGADEIDMVINIGALKDKEYNYVKKEIEEVRDSIDGKTLKVIIETCYLTDEEIMKMTEICNETYVNFIKTSTGYGTRGVNLHDIDIINKYKNEILDIKASGGIKTKEQALELIDNGVTRLGTSSIDILKEEL
ncbi:MAG: deoxyribose-phosphate aldolase [Bacilli bacterium]|nr:deoxyribose-phosphate aldolase [Bacilli bacterium]